MSFYRIALFFLLIIAGALEASAQDKYELARTYFQTKDYPKAIALYQELYAEKPSSIELYQEYYLLLLAAKDFKAAESLVRGKLKSTPNQPMHFVELGHIYSADKKEKKATEQYQEALKYINGDDILTQQLANSFANNKQVDWAIRCYERAMQIVQVPGLYNAPLAKLYNQKGDLEKAIILLVEGVQNQFQFLGDEQTETKLLELIGEDEQRQKQAQKVIINLVAAQPDNFYYSYLLTWIFSVQDNWDQAFVQIAALDKRNTQDKGRLMMDFGRSALQKFQFDVAQKAFATVVSYGAMQPRYRAAKEAILQAQLAKIKQDPAATKADIEACSQAFASYFKEFSDAQYQPILNDYALLEAQYHQQLDKAIGLLQNTIQQRIGSKEFMAQCKLQLGDYYIIKGDVWEAALLYAQVDKAFREDALGEEARFRNAKLSYYQNDFEQAQGQLSVLKASTSELIANDALYLSVLITENIPPDSNIAPLQRFAYADLLLFQNKYLEAEKLLDSIATAFPKNPLADDILLLRSKIAYQQKDYPRAIAFLKQIIEQHSKDVLADDALFRLAELYRKDLQKPDEARKYYEQLIIDYPGSSYINQARAQVNPRNV